MNWGKKLYRVLAAVLIFMVCAQIALAEPSAAVVKRAYEIIAQMETNTNYAGVSNDTNGSPSVGILQWNNTRAVSLLKKIIARDEAGAKEILGSGLYEELTQGSNSVWSSRTLSSSERARIANLLKSDAGVACQQQQAATDVTNYIETAMGLGMTDPTAMVYYADIAHQAGSGAVKKYVVKAAELAGGYAKINLEHMYKAALVYATYTKSRRTKVYNMLKENPVQESAAPVKPTGVALDKSGTVTLYLGDTLNLKAQLKPANAQSELTWKSGNSKVAKVEDGVVTPVKAGLTVIRVTTENGKTDTVKVQVRPVKVSSIKLSGTLTMKVGQKQTISAAISPANATNQSLQWKSGNKRVAGVNSKGVVLARKPGKVTIYCRATDGSKKIAKLVIKVKAK